MALADELPDAKFRLQAFEKFAEQRAKEDPDETLEWAEGLEDDERRTSAITSAVAGLATKDLTRAVEYFIASEDQDHKKAMLSKIIRNDDLSRRQLSEAREVVSKMSKTDQRMAIDTVLEINGEHIPKPLKAVMKVTGNLETLIDWAEKSERWGLFR